VNINTHKLITFAEDVAKQLKQHAKLGKAAVKARVDIDNALLAQIQQTLNKASEHINKAETGLGFAPESEIPF